MSKHNKIPKRLYKYRSFSNQTLDMLVADQIFFADPSTFNDPLDARPTLNPDLPAETIAKMVKTFAERRIKDEMSAAAKTIKYNGPKTQDHILLKSQQLAQSLIDEIRYSATDDNYSDDFRDGGAFLFGVQLETELLKRYNKGIFCLAERYECPLMWSHYGDQHKGLSLGYSVPDHSAHDLRKIGYGGSRQVDASAVKSMLDGDIGAQEKVDNAVLAKKAQAWRYEQEWRLIGTRGQAGCPLELEEVIFGMKCSETVKYAIVTALEARKQPVKFFEIHETRGSFLLKRRVLDTDDLKHYYPQRHLDVHDAFGNLNIEPPAQN